MILNIDALIADLKREGVDPASLFLFGQHLRRYSGERICERSLAIRQQAVALAEILRQGISPADAVSIMQERTGLSRATVYRRLQLINKNTEKRAA